MTRPRPSETGRIFTAMMLGLFIIVLLAMAAFGAKILNATFGQKTASDTARQGQSLICNTIRAKDAAHAIRIAEGPEGPALVLVEESGFGTFETRLYHYEGKVVEEYALAGNDIDPATATVMVESQEFSFAFENGLLSVTTDQGTTCVAMRSEQDPLGSDQDGAATMRADAHAEGGADAKQADATNTEGAQAEARDEEAAAAASPNEGGAA